MFLGGGQKLGHPAQRALFQSQLSLKNFPNCQPIRQEVLREYSGTGKRILLKKYRKLRPQGQELPLGVRSILAGEVSVSKFLESDSDSGPAVCVSSKRSHEFLMNLFEPQFFIQKC
jgi:hypothetical protein